MNNGGWLKIMTFGSRIAERLSFGSKKAEAEMNRPVRPKVSAMPVAVEAKKSAPRVGSAFVQARSLADGKLEKVSPETLQWLVGLCPNGRTLADVFVSGSGSTLQKCMFGSALIAKHGTNGLPAEKISAKLSEIGGFSDLNAADTKRIAKVFASIPKKAGIGAALKAVNEDIHPVLEAMEERAKAKAKAKAAAARAAKAAAKSAAAPVGKKPAVSAKCGAAGKDSMKKKPVSACKPAPAKKKAVEPKSAPKKKAPVANNRAAASRRASARV